MYRLGYGKTYGCGYDNNIYMYGTWVGLKRVSGSPTDWNWLTYPKETTQAEEDIRFNLGVTDFDKTNEAASVSTHKVICKFM